jgi:hypothetical protein
MGLGKRVRSKTNFRIYREKRGNRAKPTLIRLNQIVARQINKKLETKTSCFSGTDAKDITHYNFVVVDTDLCRTSNGASDPMITDRQSYRLLFPASFFSSPILRGIHDSSVCKNCQALTFLMDGVAVGAEVQKCGDRGLELLVRERSNLILS